MTLTTSLTGNENFTKMEMLSADKVNHDQVRTAFWYRLYQLTGIWHGGNGHADGWAWMSITIAQLYATLAPWSILAFRSHYHFFLAIENVLGPLFARILMMNQIQANSLHDRILSNMRDDKELMRAMLPVINTTTINCPDASSSALSPSITIISPSGSPQHSNESGVLFLLSPLDEYKSPVPQELLTWNDACFGLDDVEPSRNIITLRLDDCGVYTSPGGFNAVVIGNQDTDADTALELAMEITEEIAVLSNAPGPIPTDMPLLFTRLNQNSLEDLQSWLRTSYDWTEDISNLLAPDLTAEVLAGKLLNVGPPAYTSKEARSDDAETHTHGSSLTVETAARGRRRLAPRSDISIVVYPNDELPSYEVATTPSPASVHFRTSPVYIPASKTNRKSRLITAPKTKPPSRPLPPLPIAQNLCISGSVEELDIGMASYETWNGGRKPTVRISIGNLLSPSPRSPVGPLTATLQSMLSPLPPKRSILSPWLEAVRIDGLEPMQSPWVADHPDAGPTALFPQSPMVF
ncbi:hypothetical protein BXZ70DRAFT_1005835 [Cristinia sonorae]|uniref:Uncharacterized protein n=1 Tax=Cristinia sonorae TaxID=1940300 RepID=A0A8K0XSA0_9AGAR|nr:hypothetical protein BXZ70DRAFT_1005835 [Cristinia sonorae]